MQLQGDPRGIESALLGAGCESGQSNSETHEMGMAVQIDAPSLPFCG